MTLIGVISQQLIPKKDGLGRIVACELMIVNPAIKNLIREGKTAQIDSTIATSADIGAISMDNSLLRLARSKQISNESARIYAKNQDYIKKNLGF